MTSRYEKIYKFLGEIEIDESYFKAKRVRKKRYFYFATLVMLKRDDKVG